MVTVTQADGLPNSAQLNQIQILEGKQNFENWTMYAQLALERRGIEQLINSSIPRLTAEHPKYTKWLQLSRDIHFWLVMHVNAEIAQSIR